MARKEGRDTINGVCSVAPLLLSLMALALVVQGIIEYGNHPPRDAGLHAGLFQILMLVQIPLIVVFAATADWTARTRSVRLLVLQLGGWLVALGAVGVWEWFSVA